MPLPLGHAAIGWAAYETSNISNHPKADRIPKLRFVSLGYMTVLANLPDLDVLFGLLVNGNGASLHRGPTHSLLFAILAGYAASHAWRLWHRIPKFGFGLCVMLILSHVAADMVLTDSPVSLLWPFELYISPGHSGWGQVAHMVLFRSIQDAGIIIASMVYVFAFRIFRRRWPVFNRFAFARRRVK